MSTTSTSTDTALRALLAAAKILQELGEAGRYVWLTGREIKNTAERLEFLRKAVLQLRQRLAEGPGKYGELPVDPRTFVECTLLLNMGGEVYPKVLAEIEELCSGRYVEAVLTGGIGCVDADTEYLSPTGWRRIADYDGGLVAQYDTKTGEADFVEPSGFVKLPCGGFYHFRTKYGIDQALSPEHRVLYRDTGGSFRVITAEEMAARHAKAVNGFRGKFVTVFGMDGPGLSMSDAALRVQVMAMADGHFPKHVGNGYCVVGVKRERKIARAREILSAAGMEWSERPRPGGGVRFLFSASLREKSMRVFWGASRHQCDVILHEALHWDARSDTHRQFFSSDKDTVDFLQYAACVCGIRSTVNVDCRPGWNDCYTLTLSTDVEITMMGAPKTPAGWLPASDGLKYCFSVPKTFWVARRNGRVFVTGNTGKTTIALIATAYSLYELSCFRAPHREFGLAASSEIEFIFQSLKKELSKTVDYARFKAMLDASPYFQEVFRYDRSIESELRFPKRIIVKPLTGATTAAIGQNVFGGVIDEINFMAVVEQSKSTHADGGTFDQAREVYASIARRRQSRFMHQGRLPGMLCLVSSRQYPGEFTDRKIDEAKKDKRIFVYDKRLWEVKPDGTFGGERFAVFVGDEARKPRILEPGEELSAADQALLMQVPVEYRHAFEDDMLAALRDIAGVSTLARYPFILDSDAVAAAFGRVSSILSRPDCDFTTSRLQIYPLRIANRAEPRFAHIDVGLTGDHCGLACGFVTGFQHMARGEVVETLPVVVFDFVLDIVPPRGGEISLEGVRRLLYAARRAGLPIKWVTMDSFQSVDTRQLLAQQGFTTGLLSLDTDSLAYDVAKQAFYDTRVLAPEHPRAQQEFVRLERDPKTRKVDHSPQGSKDCSDAMAGVIFGLTMRREIWARHGIPLNQIPRSLLQREPQGKNSLSYVERLRAQRGKIHA